MRYVTRAWQFVWLGPNAEFGARGMINWALKRVFALIGLVLMVLGLVLLPTPIPLGLLLTPLGIFILIRNSDTAKRIFFRWARTYPITSEHVRKFLRRKRSRVAK